MVMKMFHVSSLLMPEREEVGRGLKERRDLSSHLLSI